MSPASPPPVRRASRPAARACSTMRGCGAKAGTRASDARPAAHQVVDAFAEGRAHVLTLTSAEGVDNLMRAVGAAGRASLARVPAFAPHPRIVEHARAAGLDARLSGGGDAGLIAALLEWAPARS